MARKYQVISGDGHLESPPDFVKHVPEKWKDRAPRLISLPDGDGDAWMMEGMPLSYVAQNLKGRGTVRYKGRSYTDPDGSRTAGAGDGVQRLREQDEDGIDAELLFAPIYAVHFVERIPDREIYLAMIQSYNTWLAEYCSPAPDRLIGNPVIPVSGIDDAINELERVHGLGFKTVQLINHPGGGQKPGPDDDRFYERSLELGVAISPHMFFGGMFSHAVQKSDRNQWGADAAMSQHVGGPPAGTMAQLIINGTFDRIPELRLYFAEIDALKLPAMLYYMDRDFHEFNDWFQVDLKMEPSEYIRQHARYGMVREAAAVQIGVANPDLLPLELFMWGSDFPHGVGTFPDSEQYIADAFANVDDELRHKVLVGNAADHLGLDLDADITETPSD
jgi:predicted TIM-barrel fold metal-dependent hydrolase